MTDSLTLSAQAIVDAYDRAPVDNKRSVAAVLRAAVDQVSYELLGVRVADCSQLLAIAAELEDQP